MAFLEIEIKVFEEIGQKNRHDSKHTKALLPVWTSSKFLNVVRYVWSDPCTHCVVPGNLSLKCKEKNSYFCSRVDEGT